MELVQVASCELGFTGKSKRQHEIYIINSTNTRRILIYISSDETSAQGQTPSVTLHKTRTRILTNLPLVLRLSSTFRSYL
jgi:hypothetical protein